MAEFPAVIDLSALGAGDGFRIVGGGAYDLAGWSVASAGDVDRDGRADILIGAPHGDGGGYDAGEAYVVFGKAGRPGGLSLATLAPADGFVIRGDAELDNAGWSVSAAGDFNHDGYGDIILGALFGDDGGANAGEAYLIFGKAGGFGAPDGAGRNVIDLTSLAAGDGVVIRGDAGGQAGFSVACAGDFNGDGYDDVIVEAPYGGEGGTGAAYVVFGRAGGLGAADGAGRYVVDVAGLSAGDGFAILAGGGRSVASAGDFNHDGYDDILLSVPGGGTDQAGAAYVVFGHGGPFATLDLDGPAPAGGFAIRGDSAGDQAGFSVASAGDVDGDLYDDIVIGALFGDDGGDAAGEAYVVFGHGGAFADVDLASLAPARGFVIQGVAGGWAGFSVAAAGDVNGDGHDDLIVGAPYAGEGGAAYVVFGRAGGFGALDAAGRAVVDLAALDGSDGFAIRGAAGDRAGWSVAAAGDVDGDGLDDLIVGAYSHDSNGLATGAAYVIYGRGTIIANNAPVVTSPVDDRHSAEDTAFSYQVPAGTFTDADGDPLTYAAALADGAPLPSWLSFDPATRTFAGTPPSNFNGILSLRITASDGTDSAADIFDLVIDPVNDAPVIQGMAGGSGYSEGSPPRRLAFGQNATLADPDSADFDGGTLTVTITGSGADPAEDELLLDPSYAGVTLAAGQVVVGGHAIGAWSGGTGGVPFSIAFNNEATAARIREVLNAIAYRNSDDVNPTAGTRTFTTRVTDGDGGTSAPATVGLSVSRINDAPVNTVGAAAAGTTGSPIALTGVSVLDVDESDAITVHLAVAHGTLTLLIGVPGGITAANITGGGNGTGIITITATEDQINATLAAPGGLVYQSNAGFTGSDALTVSTYDGVSSDPVSLVDVSRGYPTIQTANILAADLDNDGDLDLLYSNNMAAAGKVGFTLNRGDGGIDGDEHLLVAGNAPTSLAVADINGDGLGDIVVTNYNQASPSGGTIGVFLNTGGATFAPITVVATMGRPFDLVAGDFDQDGRIDLAVVRRDAGAIQILVNGAGGLTSGQAFDTRPAGSTLVTTAIATADFNGDGDLDLVTVNQATALSSPGNISIHLGGAGATFGPAIIVAANQPSPVEVAVGDLNGDGKADIVFVTQYPSNGGTVRVLLGNGDGSFAAAVSYAVPGTPRDVAIADVNGDGTPDLAVAVYTNGLSVLTGFGNGTFRPAVTVASGNTPESLAAGDLDGDGDVDFALGSDLLPDVGYVVNAAQNRGDTDTKAIGVTPPNHPPVVTSGAAASVAENSPAATIVYQATATDADGEQIGWSLTGTDAGLLTIDAGGAVRLLTPADYENRTDYSFNVVASDSTTSTAKAVTLSVTDVNEGPATPVIDEINASNGAIGAAQAIDRGLLAIVANADLPDDSLPSATISGAVSLSNDRDYYSIALQAGELLILDVDGTTNSLDSVLRLYGPDLVLIGEQDDLVAFDPGSAPPFPVNTDSQIRFRAATGGTYYFSIESFDASSSGAYRINVGVGPPATTAQIVDENIDALLSGNAWNHANLTFGFPTLASQYPAGIEETDGVNELAPFTAQQQAATAQLLQLVAGVSSLTFTQLVAGPGNADLRYAMSDAPERSYAYYPTNGGPGSVGGTAWFNKQDFNDPIRGNQAWLAILHETGHLLGLKHASEFPQALGADRDSIEYSVMSYRSYPGVPPQAGYANGTFGYPQTLMMYDIAALQRIYGANFATNAGDSVYSWSSTTGEMSIGGAGQGAPGDNRVFMTIWDGGGTDTYDLSNHSTATVIDLRPGEWTITSQAQLADLGQGHSARGNVANALLYEDNPLSLIENAIGSQGADRIIANRAANHLTGNDGADRFAWMASADAGTGAFADIVTDFVRGTDRIDLSAIDFNPATAGRDRFAFIGTAAFSHVAGEIRYEVMGGNAHILADLDGDGAADMEIVLDNVTTLAATDLNEPPTLAHPIPDQHGAEDAAFSYQVPANSFTDPDGDPLSYGAALADGSALPSWLSFDAATRTFSGTPPPDYEGTLSLRVTADDGIETASDIFDLVIDPVSDAPAGVDAVRTIDEDGPYVFTAADFGFRDADGDALLAVRISSLPAHGALYLDPGGPGGTAYAAIAEGQTVDAAAIAAGMLFFVPDADESGAPYAGFTFQVRDDGGTVGGGQDLDPTPAMFTLDVTAANDAPTATGLGGDTATFTEGASGIVMDLGGDAIIADIDSADFGGGSLSVAIADGLVADEDRLAVLDFGAVSLSGNVVLVNGTAIGTFGGGTGGTPLQILFDPGVSTAAVQILIRSLGYENLGGDNPTAGTRAISWTLIDGDGTAHGGSDTLILVSAVDVVAVNDAPAGADRVASVGEDGVYTLQVADFGFSDAEGDALRDVKIASLPGAGTILLNGVAVSAGDFIAVSDIAAGRLTFVPAPDGEGAAYANLTFQVRDDGGGADMDAAPNSLTFDVVGENDAPALDLDGGGAGIGFAASYAEDSPGVAIGGAIAISDIDAGDSIEGARAILTDPRAGDMLSVAGDLPDGIVANVQASAGQIVLVLTGIASAADYAAALGQLRFSSASQDPTGGGTAPTRTITVAVDDGQANSATASTIVTIGAVDDAPVARDDAIATDEETVATGSVFADHGAGPDGDAEGDPFIVSAVNGLAANVGIRIALDSGALLTLDADGTFVYDPNHAFDSTPAGGTSSDNFSYTLAGGATAMVVVTISGLDGDDLLLGTAGDDLLSGGIGNDLYFVDSAGDAAIEAAGEGFDIVYAAISHALAPGSEIEVLSVSDPAATFAIDLTGNGFGQQIFGNAGANVLNGGGGADALYGRAGNDVYIVDTADVVIDGAGEGFDQVYSTTTYALGAGTEIEVLSVADFASTNALNLIGNEFGQQIFGNDGDNVLTAGGGVDALYGRAGNDIYSVDALDVVVDGVGQGFDIVYSSATYAINAGAEIELLSVNDFASTNALNLIGNEFGQQIFGNAGNNVLTAGGGIDALYGFGGNDVYSVDALDIVVDGVGQGFDIVYSSATYAINAGAEIEILSVNDFNSTNALNLIGNEFGQQIFGNDGDNNLTAGGGADALYGRAGNDTYSVDGQDVVVDGAGQGHDIVYTSGSFTLDAAAEIEILSVADTASTTAINLTGNGFGQQLYGNAGANVLNGGGGHDTLAGNGGADTFVFNAFGAANYDFFTDFDPADDIIALDRNIFTAIGPLGALDVNAFTTSGFNDASDRISYAVGTGMIFYDADGSGTGEAVLVAVALPGLAISELNFIVI